MSYNHTSITIDEYCGAPPGTFSKFVKQSDDVLIYSRSKRVGLPWLKRAEAAWVLPEPAPRKFLQAYRNANHHCFYTPYSRRRNRRRFEYWNRVMQKIETKASERDAVKRGWKINPDWVTAGPGQDITFIFSPSAV